MCRDCCKAEEEETVRTCTECGFDVNAKGFTTEVWCGSSTERCSVCHHRPCDDTGGEYEYTNIYDYM